MRRLLSLMLAAGMSLAACGGASGEPPAGRTTSGSPEHSVGSTPTSRPQPRARGPFFVADCGGRLVARPTHMILACGDAGAILDHLRWTRHGRSEATAVGTFRTKSGCCGPTSAGRVKVRAYFPFPLDADTLAYGCMTVEPKDDEAESWAGDLIGTWGLRRLRHLPRKFPVARCGA